MIYERIYAQLEQLGVIALIRENAEAATSESGGYMDLHFNWLYESEGGVVISLARALSFNGLANAFHIAAINGGRHVAPCFAGDTIYAWSEVLEKAELPGRTDVGALRTRLVAVKNADATAFPLKDAKGEYDPSVVLDLDIWLLLPR